MSIPRFAIERPVMMSMISCIIVLLGVISLSRLPVDLLPDVAQPTINVRVNYTGVGPQEMESLVTRPLACSLRTPSIVVAHSHRYQFTPAAGALVDCADALVRGLTLSAGRTRR